MNSRKYFFQGMQEQEGWTSDARIIHHLNRLNVKLIYQFLIQTLQIVEISQNIASSLSMRIQTLGTVSSAAVQHELIYTSNQHYWGDVWISARERVNPVVYYQFTDHIRVLNNEMIDALWKKTFTWKFLHGILLADCSIMGFVCSGDCSLLICVLMFLDPWKVSKTRRDDKKSLLELSASICCE